MSKFYDLRSKHIKILTGQASIDSYGDSRGDRESYYEFRTIVPKIFMALEAGNSIKVHLSEKANGENA